MSWLAPPGIFAGLVALAVGAAALAALVLVGLIVRDWRRGSLW